MRLSAEALVAIVGLALALPSAVLIVWRCYRRYQRRRRARRGMCSD